MSLVPPSDGPSQFAEWRREIERRLAAVETARSAQRTEIYDANGNLLVRFSDDGVEFFDDSSVVTWLNEIGVHILNTDGDTRATLNHGKGGGDDEPVQFFLTDVDDPDIRVINIGDVAPAGSGNSGLFVREPVHDGGTALIATGTGPGLQRPEWSSGWLRTDTADLRMTTSATFEECWRCEVGRLYHDVVDLEVAVYSAPGTTGEVRIREALSGHVTSALAIPADANTSHRCQWLHDTPLDAAYRYFRIEARRTGGSGQIGIRPLSQLMHRSSVSVPDATSGGWV